MTACRLDGGEASLAHGPNSRWHLLLVQEEPRLPLQVTPRPKYIMHNELPFRF